MEIPHIAFIGAGNMASSIIGGLLSSGHPASKISAADPFPDNLIALQAKAPVAVFTDNAEAIANADIVILAVKPQIMAEAAKSIAVAVKGNGSVVISIAAGVTIANMQQRLGADTAVVRCMPNTPALLGCGASALFGNDRVSEIQRDFADRILTGVGITIWVTSEADLDAITALSGSGPAYFFLFMEAMIDAAGELGLDRETATLMTQQTALGAARMAIESDVDLRELRRRVTSPAGTTEAAIHSFENENLRSLVQQAKQAAHARAIEMASEMG